MGPAVALALGFVTGCSLIVDFSECQSNADCTDALGRQLVCSSDQTCVPRPAPESTPCASATTCVDLYGADHLCGPRGVCQAISSDACTVTEIPEGVDPDALIWIASILPVSPPFDATFLPLQNAVQLAVEDLNLALEQGPRFAWVGCDEQGRAEAAVEVAQHLVDDLGIQAIIGPGFSESVVAVAEQVTVPQGVLTITPTASAKMVTELEDRGLVWRTIPSDTGQAAAIGDLLLLLDPPPERILILAKNDAYGSSLLEDAGPRIKANLPEAKVATLLYQDPSRFTSTEELLNAYGTIIGQGFAHNADVVVMLGTAEITQLVLFYLQTRDAVEPPPALPRFVVSHGGISSMREIVEQVDPAFRAALMPALHGVSPEIRDPENFESFNIRYRIRFSDQDALTPSALGYDAAMVALLGTLAAGGEAGGATGTDIAKAIPRLSDLEATQVSLGQVPTSLREAETLLQDGENINLHGVSGALDFLLAAGEVRNDYIHWTVVPRSSDPDEPVLVIGDRYVMNPPPATDGEWETQP